MNSFKVDRDWSHSSSKDFWGEIAPCEHVVQVYETEKVFLDLLHGFVSEGLDAGDCVIVIATLQHLEAVNTKLRESGFELSKLEAEKVYFPLEAEAVLSKFMVNDWPDEELFNKVAAGIVSEAKSGVRQFRAFGEMVALLWAKGNVGATVRLEHLWNKFRTKHSFCLFCAYPQNGFTENASESLAHLCQAHSKLIAGVTQSQTEVFYKAVEKQVG
ncbi:MAG TPA: MEDS domain-containing protein [Chryseolinea sp.]|nr:MEDS domain-containing protein [Chryseolinea sp.]